MAAADAAPVANVAELAVAEDADAPVADGASEAAPCAVGTNPAAATAEPEVGGGGGTYTQVGP